MNSKVPAVPFSVLFEEHLEAFESYDLKKLARLLQKYKILHNNTSNHGNAYIYWRRDIAKNHISNDFTEGSWMGYKVDHNLTQAVDFFICKNDLIVLVRRKLDEEAKPKGKK